MNKLKTFFRTYTKSVSEPQYYNDVLKAPVWFSFKYFFFFYLILSFFSTILFSVRQLPKTRVLVNHVLDEVATNYPEELVLKFEDNQLQVSGVTQPYQVAFPTNMEDQAELTEFYDHAITLNSESDEASSSSLLNLGKTTMVVNHPDGTAQVIEYQELDPSLTFDRAFFSDKLPEVKQIINQVMNVAPFFYWMLHAFLLPLVMLGFLLVLSGITYLAAFIGRQQLSYKKSYQLGLHAVTFAETASFLQDLLFAERNLPSIFTLAFFGVIMFVLWVLKPATPEN